jgi:hypothetical protein
MSKYSQTKLVRRAIRNEIRFLETLDLRTADEKYVERLISQLLGHGYIQRILKISGLQAFRVRINEEKKLFENVKDLWWPPPTCVKRGRCNENAQPVFYYTIRRRRRLLRKSQIRVTSLQSLQVNSLIR